MMKRSYIIWIAAMLMSAGLLMAADASFSVGDKGKAVSDIQKQLVQHGMKVQVDGVYGKNTAKAVRQFQRRHRLKPDGVVGPPTYKALTGRNMPDVITREQTSNAVKGTTVQKNKKSPVSRNAREITEEAKKYIGTPYRFGGVDRKGFDCSGFIQYVYGKKGITLPRRADEQYRTGHVISEQALAPGDLVFFSTYEKGASHSGIYMGNGSFISATTSRGIAVNDMKSGYWRKHYIGARRVL